jgi:RimJ/RimL family protein N-acetyltransferase
MGAFDSLQEIPVLAGNGMSLRPLTPADAPDAWAYYSDPEVYGPTSLDIESLAATEAGLQSMADSFARRESIRWGIVPAGVERIAGDCGFFNFDGLSAEIGYLLAGPFWGRGIASEAVDLMLTFAFDTLGLQEVKATVMDGNERSLRLLDRKAFQRVELLPRFRNVRGEMKDFWLLRCAR